MDTCNFTTCYQKKCSDMGIVKGLKLNETDTRFLFLKSISNCQKYVYFLIHRIKSFSLL